MLLVHSDPHNPLQSLNSRQSVTDPPCRGEDSTTLRYSPQLSLPGGVGLEPRPTPALIQSNSSDLSEIFSERLPTGRLVPTARCCRTSRPFCSTVVGRQGGRRLTTQRVASVKRVDLKTPILFVRQVPTFWLSPPAPRPRGTRRSASARPPLGPVTSQVLLIFDPYHTLVCSLALGYKR